MMIAIGATQAPPALSVAVLGPLHLSSPAGPVDRSVFGGRKPRALFERLVMARSALVTKEALVEALWPGPMPNNAMATLESYVSGLRKRLFEDRSVARRLLATEPGGYRLANEELDLDVDGFDRLIHHAGATRSLQRSLAYREQAVALQRGELLADVVDAPWLEADRRLYHDRSVQNLLIVAESQLALGDYPKAIWCAEATLRLNPFSEEATRALMRAHYAVGHTDLARQAFARCRAQLESDLCCDPSSLTADLAAAIDAGEPPTELIWSDPAIRQLPSLDPIVADSWPPVADRHAERRHPGGRLPVLGRVEDLDTLEQLIEDAGGGTLTSAVIHGPAGSGKTTMLAELERRSSWVAVRAAYGSLDADAGYLPFAAALATALAHSGCGAAAADRYCRGPYLWADDAALHALADLLDEHGPFLFLLDDVDRADAATIDAIRWLQRNRPCTPLAIIATTYPAPRAGISVQQAIAFDRSVELTPFTALDVAPLGELGEEIRTICAGNPRYMADLWRWRRAGHDGIPPSLRESVKRQVRAFGAPLAATLQAIAHVDGPTHPEQLAATLRRPPVFVLRALRTLAEWGFVDLDEQGAQLASPLLAQILGETVSYIPVTRFGALPFAGANVGA